MNILEIEQRKTNTDELCALIKEMNENKADTDMIMRLNEWLLDINDDIVNLSRLLRRIYNTRFPELESLDLSSKDYSSIVKAIANNKDISHIDFSQIVQPSVALVLKMCFNTTRGVLLDSEHIGNALWLSEEVLKLYEIRLEIFKYIEGQMVKIAPNLSNIVGISVAAQLIGIAGGIHNLSKVPSGNIQVLGCSKKNLGGYSKASVKQHEGVIRESDILTKVPPMYYKKILRLVSYKCSLASRVDSMIDTSAHSHSPPEEKIVRLEKGDYGIKLRNEIERTIEKLVEPPLLKKIKPLEKPKEYPKNKRGGKRVRKMKEQIALTQYRRLQNRMAFGVQEEEIVVNDSVKGLGLLSYRDKINSMSVKEDTKLKESLVKQANVLLHKYKNNATSGTITSISLTSPKGIEIQNPEGKKTEKKSKYFSTSLQFKK